MSKDFFLPVDGIKNRKKKKKIIRTVFYLQVSELKEGDFCLQWYHLLPYQVFFLLKFSAHQKK